MFKITFLMDCVLLPQASESESDDSDSDADASDEDDNRGKMLTPPFHVQKPLPPVDHFVIASADNDPPPEWFQIAAILNVWSRRTIFDECMLWGVLGFSSLVASFCCQPFYNFTTNFLSLLSRKRCAIIFISYLNIHKCRWLVKIPFYRPSI